MMLEWLGELTLAEKLEAAVAQVIKEGKTKTYDMGGSNTNIEVADAVIQAVRQLL
eukprot:CAMPEP_0201281920 /NCGR_PEP_ID=MMETSP1317-20130820/4386_1 /ASSEMBLY_ACC=CAM_ASM_000770 /TAXON_ID=187299 /ORGANISM="Undescribed Undescribed, Strain Undescribed" /LENGTH=54 /DNA_ID=CAMNT_0047593173 /DNA_START=1034 /DNA_END=1198 /DNA_ORIENTATION=+